MAIERASEPAAAAADNLFAERMLYLWAHRWLIIGVAVVVGVLGYVSMLFVPEEFESKAAVFVNRLDIFDISPLNPSTVMSLAKNPELLRTVYDEYTAKFGHKPGEFEKFLKQFDIKAEVLQDTTVKKEMSPVLELSVRYRGREETCFLLESWVQNLIRKFGNVGLEEARLRVAAMEEQDRRIETELRSLEQERARLASEIVGERKMLAEALDVLAPSDLPEARENARASAGPTAEGLQFYLNQPLYINQPVPKPEGLLARYLRLQLDIERVRRGGASATTASLQQLALEEDALSATITRIQSNVSLHENSLAEMQQRLSAVIRMISDKVSERARLRDPLDRFRAVAAAYVHWDGKGLPVAGDLRALSQPVMPELRVWPKRTLVAGAAALVAVLLYVSFLLVRFPLIRHQQRAR
jgi:LPS O-antigen subunit length determinant protein (WzzB/FepE family)